MENVNINIFSLIANDISSKYEHTDKNPIECCCLNKYISKGNCLKSSLNCPPILCACEYTELDADVPYDIRLLLNRLSKHTAFSYMSGSELKSYKE